MTTETATIRRGIPKGRTRDDDLSPKMYAFDAITVINRFYRD